MKMYSWFGVSGSCFGMARGGAGTERLHKPMGWTNITSFAVPTVWLNPTSRSLYLPSVLVRKEMRKTLMLMLSLAVVMALPYPSYGQVKRQTVNSPPQAKRRVSPARPARATPGYRFRQLYYQSMTSYLGPAEGTVVDTLRFVSEEAPRLYLARVPPALPALRRGGYERRLLPLLDTLTRKYFRSESRRYAENLRANQPGENIIPPMFDNQPWLASRAEVVSVNLLVIPAGDSLLNAVVRHSDYVGRPRRSMGDDFRDDDYTESNYCFRLARGRLRRIAGWPPVYNPSAPPKLNTLELRLGAITQNDPRLATRARQELGRPCPWRQQLLLQVGFTPSGLWVSYACLLPQQEEWPDKSQLVDIILPYDSLPPRLFRFPSP
jgi:hypothetical protein